MIHENWFKITAGSGFILVVIAYSWHVSNQYREVRQKGKKTVAEVTTFGSDIFCAFKVYGGETTIRLSKPHASMRTGERYYVYYYSKIPDRFYVDFTEPVIDSISFKKTITTELQIGGDYFFFRYKVGNKSYGRYQEEIPNLKENTSYRVFYKVKEPDIAYVVP